MKRKKKGPPAVFKCYESEKLLRFPPVEEGDKIECYRCGKNHVLQSAVAVRDKRRDDLFLVYKCGKRVLFGAIFGRMIADRLPDNGVPK